MTIRFAENYDFIWDERGNGGEIPVPDVSGYDEPPKTEHMLKSYFYVPCTALTADRDVARKTIPRVPLFTA